MQGIVARFPNAIFYTYNLVRTGELSIFFVLILLLLMVAVVAGIIFIERAQRRIPIQYAKRLVGRKMYGGYTTYLPLKINSAGVIPPIFASSVLMFPATIAGFIAIPWVQELSKQLSPGSLLHIFLYVGLIIFFTYFYTAVIYNPVEIAENLQKNGGFITGVRPGQKTSEYIYRVLSRLTFIGALYLSAVCVLPEILIAEFKVPFYFGGTSLLIAIGVALDTVSQIETHMISRSYDGFFKRIRIKGRKD